MRDRIKTIMSAMLDVPVEEIHDDASMDTLEAWDSVMHMNLVLALEQQFQIVFTDEEMINLVSLELIEAILEEKIAA